MTRLLVYRVICPRVLWDLLPKPWGWAQLRIFCSRTRVKTVQLSNFDLPMSTDSTHAWRPLQTRVTDTWRKKWSGLAHSADPARLYLSKNEGLDLMGTLQLHKIYMQVTHASSLLRTIPPPSMWPSYRLRKGRTSWELKPMLTVCDSSRPWHQQEDLDEKSQGGSEISRSSRTPSAFLKPASQRGGSAAGE